ncbi:MAG: LacI family DNA-binding transcriptional regulator [Spirochaetales bacterium]|nr:LacI family DNA-binding transcriptional regulator [Spirochaetales bacterium]
MGTSMKDVARLANVSTATVSHVINKTRNVNPETEEKVLKAIKDLNYNVNPVARNLRSGSSRIIGYVVSNLANYFFMDIALEIDAILSKNGYNLIYINSGEDPEKERKNIENLVMQNVDGLIVAPLGRDCQYVKDIVGDKCPCIFFDRKPEHCEWDTVLSTNVKGTFDGTEYLIKRGYKRIAFVGSRLDVTMQERISGYTSALTKHGIDVDEDLIKSGSGRPRSMYEQKRGDAYYLAETLITEQKVDAILCGNALATVGVMTCLKDKGCRIPEDVGVIGFDDDFWMTMGSPQISAITQDKAAIGAKTAEILLERIKGSKKPIQEYRIPTDIILRESC